MVNNNKLCKKKMLDEFIDIINSKVADLDKVKRYQDGVIEVKKLIKEEFRNTTNLKRYINSELKNKFLSYLLDYYKPNVLQGDTVEHPDYIRENNISINYLFYLTNQIRNPTIQFLNF